MSGSPYQSPQSPSYSSADPGREPVRRVARYQRHVILALLANIGANILSFGTVGQDVPIRVAVGVLAVGIVLFAMFSIFRLGRELMGTAAGILFAIAMIIPCVSLIVLLVVNQKATSFLQKNGVRVGFLGTNPDTI